MKSKEIKIQFATFFKILYKSAAENSDDVEGKEIPFYEIDTIIEYIISLSRKKRFYDLKSDKFCFLDENTKIENNIISGYFKSARNEFRPNIINSRSLTKPTI